MARVVGAFLHVERGDDERFFHDGLDGGIFEEVLEEMAGAAPGGAEGEQDVLVLGGGGGFGVGEDGVGAEKGWGLSVEGGAKRMAAVRRRRRIAGTFGG